MAKNKIESNLLISGKRLFTCGANRMFNLVGDGAVFVRKTWGKWNSKDRSNFRKNARLLVIAKHRIDRENLVSGLAGDAASLSPQIGVFQLAEAYFEAARMGDTQELAKLLAVDVSFESGNGKFSPTATRKLRGSRLVIPALDLISRIPGKPDTKLQQLAYINGLPGFVSKEDNGHVQSTALEIKDGRIARIFVERTPYKSGHLIESLH